MKTLVAPTMESKNYPKELTAETVHLFPTVVQEAYHARMKNPHEIVLSSKYLDAQKSNMYQKLLKFAKTNPGMAPKEIQVQVISPVPDFVPPEMIAELASYLRKEWKKLTQMQPVEA